MLRTIEDYNQEIEALDQEIDNLRAKRRLLRIERERLGGEAVHRRKSSISFLDVLDIIKITPGLNGRTIGDRFNPPRTKVQMTNALVYLRKLNAIENRGKHGQGARWYIKEN